MSNQQKIATDMASTRAHFIQALAHELALWMGGALVMQQAMAELLDKRLPHGVIYHSPAHPTGTIRIEDT